MRENEKKRNLIFIILKDIEYIFSQLWGAVMEMAECKQ